MNLVYKKMIMRIPGLIREIMPWITTEEDIIEANGKDIKEAINDYTGNPNVTTEIPLLIIYFKRDYSIGITYRPKEDVIVAYNRFKEQYTCYSSSNTVGYAMKEFVKEIL